MFTRTLSLSLVLLAAATAAAQEKEGVSLTIYSTASPGAVPPELYQPALRRAHGQYSDVLVPGYAQVRQQRRVPIGSGQSPLRFTDVAALIEPTTVMFESLTDAAGTTVLEQNFEFDLVSADKLLERFLDRPIRVVYPRTDGGEPERVSGKLLSARPGQLILMTDNKDQPVQILPTSDARLGLSELPGGLITRPTLVWLLNSATGGDQLVRVTYQTSGITWWADYNAVFAEDARDANKGSLDLGAWVSILNGSGANYPDAALKLVAGDVQRAPQAMPSRRAFGGGVAANEALSAPQFQEKAFFEYHLYTLQRRTTLPDNSTKQIELFPTRRNIPCERVYVYYGMPTDGWGYGGPMVDAQLGVPMNKKVDVYVRFVNDEASGLGMPLPSGRVRVNKLDPSDNTLEFIGENVLDHTPRREKVLLKLGSAFDVVGERKQTDFQYNESRRRIDESFEIRVRNRKQEPVRVIVKETLFRWSGWEITKKSTNFDKIDYRTIHFPVDVAPDKEVVVTYSVRYEW
ncbi:MAG: DUF4139 domain-containing protein [Phycisphaerae bacterium]